MPRFVINVTHNDQRLFSTNRAASIDAGNINALIAKMQVGFPEADGYKVEGFEITSTNAVTKVDASTGAPDAE